MKYYLNALKNYAIFDGRARMGEFWYFALFNAIFATIAFILDNIFGTTFEGARYNLIYRIYTIVVFIPGLAVTVRRLHDQGKSGRFLFIILIPLIGVIWLLVLMATDGDAGKNKYGANPKKIA